MPPYVEAASVLAIASLRNAAACGRCPVPPPPRPSRLLATIRPIPLSEEQDPPPVPAWRVRRRTCSRPDAQQRWERASHQLLQWTKPPQSPQSPQSPQPRLSVSPTALQQEEQTDDHRDVCARLQSAPRPADPI